MTFSNDYSNLIAITGLQPALGFAYNGPGDRLQQTFNGQTTDYSLDINTDLPDVLTDNSNAYIHGLGNVSQIGLENTSYFLGDALGSTRQLTDSVGDINLSQSYDPFGSSIGSMGTASSIFGYTGQQTDSYIKLINLRSRLYSPDTGRYLTKDSWQGDDTTPMSYNAWLYVDANPINFTDPSGNKKYDRKAAINYANAYADGQNWYYINLGDADCTNFASQVLKAGGLEDHKPEWYYNFPWGYFGSLKGYGFGPAWVRTDKLFDFLTKTEGFTYQTVFGTIPYSNPDGVSGYRIPNPNLSSRDSSFIFPGVAENGDIVFYHQKDTDEVKKGEYYNHAGVIVDPSGPKMVDHSDTHRKKGQQEVINETGSEVDVLVVVHIPDDIPDSPTSNLGCISPIVSSLVPYLQ